MYSGRRWALIEEHLHDVLGRQARDAGDAPAAAQHFMAMLSCPQNTLYCQRCVTAGSLRRGGSCVRPSDMLCF